jgi:hypothetical protein
VNIESEELIQSYRFPEDVLSYNDSFLNDIVLDETNGYAYFSNAQSNGGIVVYNIKTQQSRMFTGLSTQRNASYDFCVDSDCYGTDSAVGMTPSDGIAISSDGRFLYWSAVQGEGLYMLNTSYLHDFSLSNRAIEEQVILLGMKGGQSDGMLMLGDDLYFGSIKDSSLEMVADLSSYRSSDALTVDRSIKLLSSSDSLRWIDTFSTNPSNPEKSLYITSNKLDLFFTLKMDFSGKSGSNFRIMRVDL